MIRKISQSWSFSVYLKQNSFWYLIIAVLEEYKVLEQQANVEDPFDFY